MSARWILVLLAAATLLVLVTNNFWIQIGHGDSPIAIPKDGVIDRIENCENPVDNDQVRCAALFCEKYLFDQGLIEPYTKIEFTKAQYAFSDAPSKSIHTATILGGSTELELQCVVDALRVVSANWVVVQ